MKYFPLEYRQVNLNNHGCNYQIFDKNGKVVSQRINGACHGGVIGCTYLSNDKKSYMLMYIEVDRLPYSLPNLKRWMQYLRQIGFKSVYEGEKVVKYKTDYQNFEENCYVFRLNAKDYNGRLHVFAAVTAMRYIHYEFRNRFTLIPQKVFELKSIFGRNLGNLQAISLAYYILGQEETGHAFIGYLYYGNGNHFIPLRVFNERISKENDYCLNSSLLSDNPVVANLKKEYEAKNYQKIAKLLKIKYKP